MTDFADVFFMTLVLCGLLVTGWKIGEVIFDFFVPDTPQRKIRSRRVQQLAADYDLPKKHVARAIDVFGVFPLLETQRLRQTAEEDQLSTLDWHMLYCKFVEQAAQKHATVTKTEAEMV